MTLEALLQLSSGALVFATNFALVVGLAAVGAAVTERSGVLNLGHEGVMLLGAAAGFVVAYKAGNPWRGGSGHRASSKSVIGDRRFVTGADIGNALNPRGYRPPRLPSSA